MHNSRRISIETLTTTALFRNPQAIKNQKGKATHIQATSSKHSQTRGTNMRFCSTQCEKYVFLHFEGVAINLVTPLWMLFDTKSFLEMFVPKFADLDPLFLSHPLVLLFARSWAYMIIVLGIIEVVAFAFSGSKTQACFLLGALWGDFFHLSVYSIYFMEHGVWDFGALFGIGTSLALLTSRSIWLSEFFWYHFLKETPRSSIAKMGSVKFE